MNIKNCKKELQKWFMEKPEERSVIFIKSVNKLDRESPSSSFVGGQQAWLMSDIAHMMIDIPEFAEVVKGAVMTYEKMKEFLDTNPN